MQEPAINNPVPTSREELARYILANRDRVIAVARTRLSPGARAVFDSEDVFSSVARRMDRLAQRGRLRLGSEAELWGLITTIVRNEATSKTRLIERARSLLTEDHAFAAMLLARAEHCPHDDDADELVLRMAAAVRDPDDRQMFFLRVRGATHRAVASALGIKEPAARKRWSDLTRDLIERFGAPTGD